MKKDTTLQDRQYKEQAPEHCCQTCNYAIFRPSHMHVTQYLICYYNFLMEENKNKLYRVSSNGKCIKYLKRSENAFYMEKQFKD